MRLEHQILTGVVRIVWSNSAASTGCLAAARRACQFLNMANENPEHEVSLYERIGGSDAVERLVGAFYKRVLADPELLRFFQDTPTDKLERMQQEFFSAALGGPITYTGRPIGYVHHQLHLKPPHLARFLDHLLATLKDRELSEEDIYAVISRINKYADEITGTTSVDG